MGRGTLPVLLGLVVGLFAGPGALAAATDADDAPDSAPAAMQVDPCQGFLKTHLPWSLPRGSLELVSGLAFRHDASPPFLADEPGFVRDEWRGTFVDLLAGLGAGSEVRLEAGVQLIDERHEGMTHGVEDARLTYSYQMPVTALAVSGLVSIKLPNASDVKRLGTDETDVILAASLGWVSRRWGWGGHLGLGILGHPVQPGTQDDVVVFGLAAWMRGASDRRISPFGEIEGHVASRFGNDVRNAAVGVMVGRHVPFVFSVRYGLTSVSPDRGAEVRVRLLRRGAD